MPPGSPGSISSSGVDEGRFVPGTMLAGRYRIAGLLGRGGMGEVYRATDLTLGQAVALKFLPEATARDERALARFYNEVRMARQVAHPNVCRVYDIGQVEGLHYISMEYVDGEDLGSLLRRIGRLPVDKALETARKLCAGLAAAHEKGVLHRDLKPANIMIDGRGQVLIMDFGLAGLSGQLQGDIRSGTPAYMSPEQLAETEVTVRSDIYALGLVLYELFTGKRAFQAASLMELMEMQERVAPASITALVKELDPAVERVIQRCLQPDPRQRPASALAVAAGVPGGDPLAAARRNRRAVAQGGGTVAGGGAGGHRGAGGVGARPGGHGKTAARESAGGAGPRRADDPQELRLHGAAGRYRMVAGIRRRLSELFEEAPQGSRRAVEEPGGRPTAAGGLLVSPEPAAHARSAAIQCGGQL